MAGRGELPAAYGTGKMLLVARDPHWVYAHWDLTDEQLRAHNRESQSGHLEIRVYPGVVEGEPLLTQNVHPESRNWFIHVPRAGGRYIAELGYVGKDGKWNRVSTSRPTVTPAEELSAETWVRFETLPMDVPMGALVEVVKSALSDNVPLIEAIAQLRAQGFTDLPLPQAATSEPAPWTPEQERALASVISMDEVRRLWIGSLEITELVRRQLARGVSSGGVPISSAGMVGELSSLSSLSSPMGGAPAERGFWFNVNAELIIYGATDPRATVRIGDRPITLRPDGTFSYRFALPDGEYGLPIQVTSPDGVETRSAELAFRRASQYRGEVGAHPQDQALRPPRVENVA